MLRRTVVASPAILWHIIYPDGHETQRTPYPETHDPLRFLAVGRQLTLLLTGCLTLATLIFVCLMGPLAEPDFWHPVQIVNLMANLIMFAAVNLIILAPLGYGWHLLLAGVDAAVSHMTQHAGHSLLPRLAAVFVELGQAFARCLLERTLLPASIESLVRALQAAIRNRLSQQRPKSKAPIFLFQQAPLFLAP